ncbi:hypothetical protein H4Q26_013650 [Puccinia striiformis f. sp. tritici PST-130]|nr:hypothetical protein H4Q26_013650 [Puccinia striiformis f. sp. tritici PST-130]
MDEDYGRWLFVETNRLFAPIHAPSRPRRSQPRYTCVRTNANFILPIPTSFLPILIPVLCICLYLPFSPRVDQPHYQLARSIHSPNRSITDTPANRSLTIWLSPAQSACLEQGLRVLRLKTETLTQLSTLALLRSDVIGHSIENNLTQSEHSRREHPQAYSRCEAQQNEGVDQEEVTSNGPHPYDLILPGEEIRKIPNKTRTMSAATAPATYWGEHQIIFTWKKVLYHSSRASAATVSRGSNSTEDVFEEDDHPQDAKRLARHDTQMLLVSFNSLLGRDGGGKAVEQLIAFILQGGLSKVVEEVTALVKHVLRDVPTLQAAYVSVYMHEITEQIQKIGGLLFLEPELLSMYVCSKQKFELRPSLMKILAVQLSIVSFENIYSRFGGVANTKATGCQELSFSSIWQILVDKLTTSPVYQSALLKVIETFCKLLLSSEQLRDGLWTSFSQAFSQAQRSPADDTTANVTGLSQFGLCGCRTTHWVLRRPFVKYFISWLAIVDDLLTKLALETSAVMNQPLSLPMGPRLTTQLTRLDTSIHLPNHLQN